VAPTEAELDAYWRKVAKHALVHLANRPLKLVRRVGGTIFYHKGPLPLIPQSVHQLTIAKREGGEGVRVWVDDVAGLLGLVEMGVVELHPWNATVNDIEHADRATATPVVHRLPAQRPWYDGRGSLVASRAAGLSHRRARDVAAGGGRNCSGRIFARKSVQGAALTMTAVSRLRTMKFAASLSS
jgi:hypothetical protein